MSEEKKRCVGMAMATCTGEVRELYNKTYWIIRGSAEANCDGLTPCDILNGKSKLITNLSYNIMLYVMILLYMLYFYYMI